MPFDAVIVIPANAGIVIINTASVAAMNRLDLIRKDFGRLFVIKRTITSVGFIGEVSRRILIRRRPGRVALTLQFSNYSQGT